MALVDIITGQNMTITLLANQTIHGSNGLLRLYVPSLECNEGHRKSRTTGKCQAQKRRMSPDAEMSGEK